jgi:protein-L-isoaspartate(D-aspartate) O-methyltransferase
VTALLARLGGEVRSIERYATLAASAAEHLRLAQAATAHIETGDGLAPVLDGPFDRILLNGTVQAIPEAVMSLIAPAGRLVGAIAQDGSQRLVRIERLPDGGMRRDFGPVLRLAPLTSGVAKAL